MFSLPSLRGSHIDLEEKVFLIIVHNGGISTKNIISEMRQFNEKDSEEKAEKKVMKILKDFEKQRIVYAQQTRDWQMNVHTEWFVSSNEESAAFHKAIERKHGVPE
jgi:hypothetical protein